MELWHVALYGFSTFLALRTLVTLMEHHKRHFRQELARRELKRAEELAARDSTPAQAAPPKTRRKAA